MHTSYQPVEVAVEQWTIPTYPFPAAEEMPMFAETCIHQATTGNPYPARVVSQADGEHRRDREWTVVRMENEYIRLALIPALGGRIFEAYDKVTGYDFLYRQHVIKPALIGAYGSWISGGLEFNWPFHHRPSTVMPVDYTVQREADGSVIVWLSEHAPNDRTKGMVGVVLRPGVSYFETRMAVTNRTAHRHNFLWWENAAVAVHEDYRLIFPPDVTWVHNHNDSFHTTYPLASGQYGADNFDSPQDISWHKNSRLATSYFAAPSKYDFFGGYDYRKHCGVLHIADHHVSPGKKLFTWGYGNNATTWEGKLTDSDGAYAELMAGSYTDDQPDFTWLAPYETKRFSQYWYPTQGVEHVSYATLDAAVAFDREKNEVRCHVTAKHDALRITVQGEDGRILLEESADMTPSCAVKFPMLFPADEHLTVTMTADGLELLRYTEETPDYVHIPKDNKGIPMPDELVTATDLVNAGAHIDQYRDPKRKPDIYYLEALRREPGHLPALKGMGEYYARVGRYADALTYLDKAWQVECRYNQNPEDGTVNYLRGICLMRLGQLDEAYNVLRRAAWSANVIAPAMAMVAAIDGQRGNWQAMYTHAMEAVEKEHRHPLARVYAALAQWKLGNKTCAAALCREALTLDPLNHLAAFALTMITGKGSKAFIAGLNSNPAQTALDVGFDLLNAGIADGCEALVRAVLPAAPDNAMLHYTLAMLLDTAGDAAGAARQRKLAARQPIVDVFPMRAEEEDVLRAALKANGKDGFAAYLLGCILYNRQCYEAAADCWQQSVTHMPKFYIPYRNLALAYFNHLGREQEALALMRKAVELHPKDATLLTETATVMQHLGASGAENALFLDANKPDESTDQMQLTIARAYNDAGKYEEAEKVMRAHSFSPGEGAEYVTAEPYIFACFARGRLAMKAKRYEEALAHFRAAQTMPENLHVGFWNESVMMPNLYFEAAALKALGDPEAAEKIITRMASMKDEGMWNMGGEFVYYHAMSVRLGGDEMRAQRMMRDAILAWEKELAAGCRYHKENGSLYNCFVGNGTTNRIAALEAMLGYGKLFGGDEAGAAEMFRRSLKHRRTSKIAFELALAEE